MPKIIENLNDQLLCEAKRQILENGYKGTTIRSVAEACDIAIGTVYNYYKSKDMLIASVILEDWLECISVLNAQPKENKRSFLTFIYLSLKKFQQKYIRLFSDKGAEKSFGAVFVERHRQLRSQLAGAILPLCPGDDVFLSEFVAEALLTWTMAGKSFEDIYALLPEKIK